MRKIALLALVATGLLALAGTAQAKEIVSLKICGASGCNSLNDRDQLRGWEQESSSYPDEIAAPMPQSFYTMELGFGDPEGGDYIHRERAYWLPESGLTRFRNDQSTSWWRAAAHQIAMYKEVATGLEPYTPELAKVTVRRKAVADPNSYLRLLGPFPWASIPNKKMNLISIALYPSGVNPFVERKTTLRYNAARRLLIRPNGYVKLSKSLARLMMKRASLASSSGSSGSGGGHAGLYAGLGVGGAVALAVFAVARRKRMR